MGVMLGSHFVVRVSVNLKKSPANWYLQGKGGHTGIVVSRRGGWCVQLDMSWVC